MEVAGILLKEVTADYSVLPADFPLVQTASCYLTEIDLIKRNILIFHVMRNNNSW